MAYLHCTLHGHPYHIALLWHWQFRHDGEVSNIRSWHGGKFFHLFQEVGQRIQWIGPWRSTSTKVQIGIVIRSGVQGSRSSSSFSSKSRGSINMSVPGTRCREGTAPSPAQYYIRYRIVYRIPSKCYIANWKWYHMRYDPMRFDIVENSGVSPWYQGGGYQEGFWNCNILVF